MNPYLSRISGRFKNLPSTHFQTLNLLLFIAFIFALPHKSYAQAPWKGSELFVYHMVGTPPYDNKYPNCMKFVSFTIPTLYCPPPPNPPDPPTPGGGQSDQGGGLAFLKDHTIVNEIHPPLLPPGGVFDAFDNDIIGLSFYTTNSSCYWTDNAARFTICPVVGSNTIINGFYFEYGVSMTGGGAAGISSPKLRVLVNGVQVYTQTFVSSDRYNGFYAAFPSTLNTTAWEGKNVTFEVTDVREHIIDDFAVIGTNNCSNNRVCLGNLVWEDTNINGMYDNGESKKANVKIQVFRDDGDGVFEIPSIDYLFEDNKDGLIAETTTDANGNYNICLPQGDYFVRVTPDNFNTGKPLAGCFPTPGPSVSGNSDLDNKDHGDINYKPAYKGTGILSQKVTLTHGGEPTNDGDDANTNSTIDFGISCNQSLLMNLGNVVWKDTVMVDGIQQTTEVGVNGVTVELYADVNNNNVYDNSDLFAATTTTSGGGYYNFTGLVPGNYIVKIPYSNFKFSTNGALKGWVASWGKDPATDPDDDIDKDDNGIVTSKGEIVTKAISLIYNSEPASAVDGDGVNGNLTVDIGVINDPNCVEYFEFTYPFESNTVQNAGVQYIYPDNFGFGASGTVKEGNAFWSVKNKAFYTSGYTIDTGNGPGDPSTSGITKLTYNNGTFTSSQIATSPAPWFGGKIPATDNVEPQGAERAEPMMGPDSAYYMSFVKFVYSTQNASFLYVSRIAPPNFTSSTLVLSDIPVLYRGNGMYKIMPNLKFDKDFDMYIVDHANSGGTLSRINRWDYVSGSTWNPTQISSGSFASNGGLITNVIYDKLRGVFYMITSGGEVYEIAEDFAAGTVPTLISTLPILYPPYLAYSSPLYDAEFNPYTRDLFIYVLGWDNTGTYDLLRYRYNISPSGTITFVEDVSNASEQNLPQLEPDNSTPNIQVTAKRNIIAVPCGTGGTINPPSIPLKLGNLVWKDVNNDGIKNSGESGIANVKLVLYRDNGDGIFDRLTDEITDSTVTNPTGKYVFDNLLPGDYYVLIPNKNFLLTNPLYELLSSTPTEHDPNTDIDNDDNGINPMMPRTHVNDGVASGKITLAYNSEPTDDGDDNYGNMTVDFGFYEPQPGVDNILRLGNRVWEDANNNIRIDPGENYFDGVKLSLIQDNGDLIYNSANDVVIANTTTSGGGFYLFDNLLPGNYYVRVDKENFDLGQPLYKYRNSTGYYGANTCFDSTDHGNESAFNWWIDGVLTSYINLEIGNEAPVYVDTDDENGNLVEDFGFFRPVRLGNRVWKDTNNNGVRDTGEPDINGVLVNLYRDNGDGVFNVNDDIYIGVRITQDSGYYSFNNLIQGNYFVQIPSSNFVTGEALYQLYSSAGVVGENPAANNHDHGIDNPTPITGGVVSHIVALAWDQEPPANVDSDDADGNYTIDFGFADVYLAECTSTVTATAGTCSAATNQYTVTGSISITNAPASGTVTVQIVGGGSQTFTLPQSSPISYSIAGQTSDGQSHTVNVTISGVNCTSTVTYTAPISCICDICPDQMTINELVYGSGSAPQGENVTINNGGSFLTENNIAGFVSTGSSEGIFYTFCTEITQPLLPLQNPYNRIANGAATGLTNAQALRIAQVFQAAGFNSAKGFGTGNNTTTNMVAMQMAVWNAVYDTDYTINTGQFYMQTNNNAGVRALANSWLTTAQSISTPNTQVQKLVHSTGQDLVFQNCISTEPGTCNSGSNTYTLTGNVFFANAPSTGTLTISVTGGGTQSFNAPFTSPVSYSIAGLTADGASHTVTATFSANSNCVGTSTFTAPTSCLLCSLSTNCTSTSQTSCTPVNGTANVTVTGGQGTITYLWSSGETTASITNKAAGTYSVTVSDNVLTNCTSVCTVTITNSTTPPTVTCSKVDNTNCSTPNGSATATATGVTYLWSNGGTTATINGLNAGTYTVTVTSTTNSCTNTCSVTLTNNTTNPTANCTPTANSNCTTPNGQASVTTNAANPTYIWSNGSTTATITGLNAGTYTVTVTNGTTSCTNTCSAIVTSSTSPPSVTCSKVDNTNCATPNGSATATATGVTYLWSNGGTTSTISGLNAGTYTVTVTSTTNSCTNTCSVIVATTTTSPSVTCSKINNTNCSTPNGSATATATGVTYLWSNGGTSATITGLNAGTYTVTVTSSVNSCTATCSVTITNATVLPSVTCTPVQPTCASPSGGSVTASPSGGSGSFTYIWSNGGTTPSISGLSAGTYTVTVTDGNSCTSTCSSVLIPPTGCCTLNNLNLVIGNCDNNNTLINASDDKYSFTLNPTGTGIGTTYTVSGLPNSPITGTYGSATTFGPYLISLGVLNITVTDNTTAGCTKTASVTPPSSCSVCNVTPPMITVVDNVCPSRVGTINIVQSCGTGTSIQFSINNGRSWSTTKPIYSTSPMTIWARCVNNTDTTCKSAITIITTDPKKCTPSSGNQCLLIANATIDPCNNNKTDDVTNDDYFTIQINASISNGGSSNKYEVVLGADPLTGIGGNVLNSGGTTFGTPITVGQNKKFKADGLTSYQLFVRDINNNSCFQLIQIDPVLSCSKAPQKSPCYPEPCVPIKVIKN